MQYIQGTFLYLHKTILTQQQKHQSSNENSPILSTPPPTILILHHHLPNSLCYSCTKKDTYYLGVCTIKPIKVSLDTKKHILHYSELHEILVHPSSWFPFEQPVGTSEAKICMKGFSLHFSVVEKIQQEICIKHQNKDCNHKIPG